MQEPDRSTTSKQANRRGWLRAAMVALAILLLGGITWLAVSDTTVLATDVRVEGMQAAPQQETPETTETPDPPRIALTMTASLSAGSCGTATSITVAAGRAVYFCYTVRNTGSVTLTNHIIADAAVSTVYASFPYTLAVGEETTSLARGQVISATFTADETRTDTWVANNGSQQVQESASVTINAINPAISVTQRVGRTPTECSATTPYLVPASTPVYLCLTLTNTGDVPLTNHTIAISALGSTDVITHAVPPGATVNINASNASDYGIDSMLINAVNASIASTIRVTSRTAEGFETTDSAVANINIGSSRTTLAGAVRTELIASAADCPATGSNNITTEINSAVFYCLHLSNTGNVAVGFHHITAITPTVNLTITYNLPPSATVIITNGLLAQLGSPQVLGPITAARTLNSTFIVTSTNNNGFRSVASTSITAGIFVPTNTPTPVNTLPPATPTFTPSITPTPFPTQTPLPSWTPTFTPVAPTPTWTRSFSISSIDTPTPNAQAAQEVAQVVATVDTQATAFAEATVFAQGTASAKGAPEGAEGVFDSPLAAPESPLASPDMALTMTEQANQASVAVVPAETPLPPPTATETPTASPTASPSATPTSTPTPTATMRPIMLPTAAPPADVTTILGQVLGASIATTSVIFLVTGTIVFFAVLGGVVGFGFLRNNSRRFQLHKTDDAGENEFTPAASPTVYNPAPGQPKPGRARRPGNQPGNQHVSAPRAETNWPSELP